MLIRQFQKDDLESLKQVFNICYADRSPLRLINPLHRIVATVNDQVVGGAGIKYGNLHNRILEVYVAVSPAFRGKGIGAALHQKIIELNPLKENEIGYDACCFENQLMQQSFMKKLGYEKYLDCYSLTLDLNNIKDVSVTYPVESYSHFLESENSLQAIKRFLIERYIEAHRWSPPREINDEIWNDIFNEERSRQLSFVITKDNEVVGASEARENFLKEGQLEIGWSYAQKNLDELNILKNLLFVQFNIAREAGFNEAYFEIDSTEETAKEILNWLPIKKVQVFQRYRYFKGPK